MSDRIIERVANAHLGTGEKKKGTYEVKLIDSGWGSSGYYSPEVLKESGPKAFPDNTKSFINHPAEDERWNRPERDVRDILGVFTGATYQESGSDGPGLYATLTVRPSLIQFVDELKDCVGMSIAAMANTEMADADGQFGPVILELLPHPFNSVDMVTVAGRGGAIISATESGAVKESDKTFLTERGIQVPSPTTPPSHVQENHMPDLSPELVKALESLPALLVTLTEAETSRTKREEAAEEAQRNANQVNPMDAALALTEALTASGLPADVHKDVILDVKNGMSVTDAIERWKGYQAKFAAEAGSQNGNGHIVVESAGGANDAVVDVKDLSVDQMFGRLSEAGFAPRQVVHN